MEVLLSAFRSLKVSGVSNGAVIIPAGENLLEKYSGSLGNEGVSFLAKNFLVCNRAV
jgi:hypothetical protein